MCDDMIRFVCRSCHKLLSAPAGCVGWQTTCPACEAAVVVPESLDAIMDGVALLGLVKDDGAVPDGPEPPRPAAARRANRRPAKPPDDDEPDDDDEPKPGEWTVRCYDCGRRVSEKRAVRRDVTTGGWYGGSGRDFTSGSYSERVDLCRACARVRDACARQNDAFSRDLAVAFFKVFLIAGVGTLIVGALGLVVLAVCAAVAR
jgi:hypothetical protein